MRHLTSLGFRLVSALILSLSTGCEQTVELGSIPYEEKLVVRGILEPGKSVIIYFTRTLSLEEPFSGDKAAIANVEGTIVCEGVSFSLLHLGPVLINGVKTGFAEYSMGGGVIAQAGKIYELAASWNGHTIRAHTRVPDSAIIDTTYVDPSTLSRRSAALVKPDVQGEKVSINILIDSSYKSIWRDSLYSRIIGFDTPFYDYYRSRRNSRPSSSLLNISGTAGPVFWNVEGEGLGMFVGMNITRKKVFVP
ncbi:MAG: hypothetical protein HW374_1784 [Bacteroidetes bacterium]|nr:hypothetical protein [Bacteroidota bacterium]